MFFFILHGTGHAALLEMIKSCSRQIIGLLLLLVKLQKKSVAAVS